MMKKDIKRRVKEVPHDQLVESRFLIMHVNPWCVGKDMEDVAPEEREDFFDSADVLPAELAVCEFSLSDGVTKVMHQMIGINNPPPGYFGAMRVWSDKCHGMWRQTPGLCDKYDEIVDMLVKIAAVDPKRGERAAFREVRVAVPRPGESSTADDESAVAFIRQMEDNRRETNKCTNFLPIFVMPNQKAIVQGSIQWLLKRAGKNVRHSYDGD